MASFRRTGTNEQISTYGTDQTYSSLGTWESAKDGDLVTAAQSEVLECYKKSPAGDYTDNVNFNISTTSAIYTLIIRAASGHEHSGVPDAGVRFASTVQFLIQIQDDYIMIFDIQARSDGNSGSAVETVRVQNQEAIIGGVISIGSSNAGAGSMEVFSHVVGGSNTYWICCVGESSDISWQGVFFLGTGHASIGPIIYNCVFVSNDLAQYCNAQYHTTKNVYVEADSANDAYSFSSSGAGATCASSQAVGTGSHLLPGSGHRYSQTPTFEDSANDDYRITDSDTALLGYGTDLSADSLFAFDDDIAGNTISDWPIGVNEPVATGQTLTLTAGIASLEAFGTNQLNLDAAPSGVASAETFGSSTLSTGPVTITTTAIASVEAFGTPLLVLDVAPSSISSLEAFGTPVLSLGATTVAPSSISSLEAFGTPVLSLGATVLLPTGIASVEAFGTSLLTLFVSPSSISSLEAFGTALVSLNLTVAPSSIASVEAFGTAVLTTGPITITLTGISSLEAFGTAVLSTGAVTISPGGVASLETFPSPVVFVAGSPLSIVPSGIASVEAFGTSVLSLYATPSGISSLEAFGTPVVNLIISTTGIASVETFGSTTIIPGVIGVLPSSITTAEAFGTGTLGLYLLPTGISSGEAMGTPPVIVLGATVIVPSSIVSLEVFGSSLRVYLPSTIKPSEVFVIVGDQVFALPYEASVFKIDTVQQGLPFVITT